MRHIERRAAIAAAILAALLLAAALSRFTVNDAPRAMSANAAQTPSIKTDPVSHFRTEREELRSRQIGQLNDIIHDDTSDSETVNLARRQLMALMKIQETEQKLEGILNIRGFEDALVTVSEASVNVILRSQALTRRESAIILDLILRETGVTAGNVKILTINP